VVRQFYSKKQGWKSEGDIVPEAGS
jgi:hypothetical protein